MWAPGRVWVGVLLVALTSAIAVLYVASVVTGFPLIGDADHLLSRFGAAAVIGLTAALAVVAAVATPDSGVWPGVAVVLVPFGVRRLEAAYAEGVEEARRAARPASVEDRVGR